jgi:hypothetical protein
MFSLGGDPTLIERTGTSVIVDANGDNEVLLDEPTVQTLQGQASAIPRKVPITLPHQKPAALLPVGSVAATALLNQLQQGQQPSTPTNTPVAGSTNPGTGTGGTSTGSTDPGTGSTEPDPGTTTGGGDDGGIIGDEDGIIPDGGSSNESSGSGTDIQPSSSDTQLQGSSSTNETTI